MPASSAKTLYLARRSSALTSREALEDPSKGSSLVLSRLLSSEEVGGSALRRWGRSTRTVRDRVSGWSKSASDCKRLGLILAPNVLPSLSAATILTINEEDDVDGCHGDGGTGRLIDNCTNALIGEVSEGMEEQMNEGCREDDTTAEVAHGKEDMGNLDPKEGDRHSHDRGDQEDEDGADVQGQIVVLEWG